MERPIEIKTTYSLKKGLYRTSRKGAQVWLQPGVPVNPGRKGVVCLAIGNSKPDFENTSHSQIFGKSDIKELIDFLTEVHSVMEDYS